MTDEEGGISRSFLKEEIIIGSSSQPESQSSYFTGYLDQLFLVDHELETSDFEELEKRNNFFSLSWFSSIVLLFNLGEGLYPNLVDLIGGVVAFGKNNVPEDYVLIKKTQFDILTSSCKYKLYNSDLVFKAITVFSHKSAHRRFPVS